MQVLGDMFITEYIYIYLEHQNELNAKISPLLLTFMERYCKTEYWPLIRISYVNKFLILYFLLEKGVKTSLVRVIYKNKSYVVPIFFKITIKDRYS